MYYKHETFSHWLLHTVLEMNQLGFRNNHPCTFIHWTYVFGSYFMDSVSCSWTCPHLVCMSGIKLTISASPLYLRYADPRWPRDLYQKSQHNDQFCLKQIQYTSDLLIMYNRTNSFVGLNHCLRCTLFSGEIWNVSCQLLVYRGKRGKCLYISIWLPLHHCDSSCIIISAHTRSSQ